MLSFLLSSPGIYIVLFIAVLWLYREAFAIRVYFFYKDTCPGCKDIKKAWDILEPSISWFNYKVYCVESSKNRELADKFHIDKVPTLFKINKDGMRIDFTGERTVEALKYWLDN